VTRGLVLVALLLTATMVVPSARADTVETSGDVLRIAIPAVAYGLAWHRDDRDGRKQFLESFVATVASTYALKKIVDKNRPNGKDEAFPSGHAATSFAGAAFLHRRYGWHEAWPAYLLSAYVGWTRIHSDEHDTVDVLGGAALAVGWNWLLVEPRSRVSVTPQIGDGTVGMSVTMRW
jgi:membrane-associated phospholipid phosphatase